MRAQFMQSNKRKTEGPNKPSLLTNDLLSASEAYLRPKLEAQKKARLLPPKSSTKQVECPSDHKPTFDQKETLLEKCRRVQIPWRAPPGTVFSSSCWISLLLFKLLLVKGIHQWGVTVLRIFSNKGNNYYGHRGNSFRRETPVLELVSPLML